MEGSRSKKFKCREEESQLTLPIRKGYAQYRRGQITV